MKYGTCVMLFCVLLLSAVSFGFGEEGRDVYVTSLEWPPYVGETLPEQGAMAVVAREAFAAMGYTLHIEFFPWMRAIYYAKREGKYAGYFPEYYAKAIEEQFLFSATIGASPLGFLERKDDPIAWQTLDDLKAITIGAVNGGKRFTRGRRRRTGCPLPGRRLLRRLWHWGQPIFCCDSMA